MRKPQSRIDAGEPEGRRGERRADILRAARRLFGTRGYGKTTMADIAQATGVAEGTVYLYFAGKQDLVTAVAADWFQEIAQVTEREAAAIHDLADRIHFLIQRHLDVIVGNPDLYVTLVREVRAVEGYRDSLGRDVNRRYTGLMRDALEQAAEAGMLAGDLGPGTLRDLVYGGIEHVAWAAIVRGETATLDTASLARGIASTFFRGFGLRPPEQPTLETRLRRIETELGL